MLSSHWMLPNITPWAFNAKLLTLIITAATANTQKVVASSTISALSLLCSVTDTLCHFSVATCFQIMWLPWCKAYKTWLSLHSHLWKMKLSKFCQTSHCRRFWMNNLIKFIKPKICVKHLILWETVTRCKIPLLILKGFLTPAILHSAICSIRQCHYYPSYVTHV